MKEFEGRLTGKSIHSTLKSERNFMAENQEGAKSPQGKVQPPIGELKIKELKGQQTVKKTPEPLVGNESPTQDYIVAARKYLQENETKVNWDTLPVEVRRAASRLMESGEFARRGPGAMNRLPGEANFKPDDFNNLILKNFVKSVERLRIEGGGTLNARSMAGLTSHLGRLIESGVLDPEGIAEAEGILRTLTELTPAGGADSESPDRFGFYLQKKDLDLLRTEPMAWLENQFDTLYQVADEGQELNSPVVSNIQNVWTEAVRYLQDIKSDAHVQSEFASSFLIRLNLIFMRSAIDHRSIESAKEMSQRLQAHGLLTALSFEGGRVQKMYSRLSEALEDKRLAAPNFHVDAEMISKLQSDLQQEQIDLAQEGFGAWGADYEKYIAERTSDKADEKERDAIKEVARKTIGRGILRATRTAYDAFVVSQRQGVIVARGHTFKDGDVYISDPIGIFNIYNYEDLLTGKFSLFNETELQFQDEIKLGIARDKLSKTDFKKLSEEERLDYGKRVLRDLYGVADFFSSGWRIKGFQKTIKAILESKGIDAAKEEDFGLFLRLKEKREKTHGTWEKIAEIRPEEIVRLYRERADEHPELKDTLDRFFKGHAFDGFREADSAKTYDKFKREFGPVIQYLRQKGYDEFRALKIGTEGFTNEEKRMITSYLGSEKADKLEQMFAELTTVADKENIREDLMKNEKFEDIYTRVMLVDDALLDKLETPEDKNITPVSKYWSSEVGGDGLVRNFNDTEHAIKAANAYFKFIEESDPGEKVKAGLTAAEEASTYGGQDVKVDALQYTVGTLFKLSKIPIALESLGVAKLPFRKAMNRMQQIYGPSWKNWSSDELRAEADKLRDHFISIPGGKGEKVFKKIEKLWSIKGLDFAKRRALSLFLFLILASIVEMGYRTPAAAIRTAR